MPNRLAVILPDAILRDGKSVGIDPKTLSGLHAYSEWWPGEVAVIARPAAPGSNSSLTRIAASALPFDIIITDDIYDPTHRRGVSVTIALHTVGNAGLLRSDPRRLVWTAENPLKQRVESSFIGSTPMNGLRAAFGHVRRAPVLHSMIRESGGIQCNGYPTWNRYARHSPNPMLFFDTRVSDRQIQESLELRADGVTSRAPLNLGFSGRHIAIKGPQYAVEAVQSSPETSVASLFVIGAGDMTGELRELAATDARITFPGHLAYDSDWITFVRRNVDVMVLPHTQGDPAGTYLEAAALGVPVVGFHNDALSPLVSRHGIGWTVPMRDSDRLASTLQYLASNPGEVHAAGTRGIEFMAKHTFETEFRRRVLHLREVAQV